jgi:hypothetical protein
MAESYYQETSVATGLPGTSGQARLVGSTVSGIPILGTFQAGDVAVDGSGNVWVCTTAGSPGNWARGSQDNELLALIGALT